MHYGLVHLLCILPLHMAFGDVAGQTNVGCLCCRFSAVIEDGKIKTFNVEPDGLGLTCSLSNNVLKQLA